jgi:hypothetical protein
MVERRDEYCLHCGATSGLVIHHRKNRGSGGSKLLDRADNLLLVCATYNSMMESDKATMISARDFGHKLQSWEEFSDPVFDQISLTWWILSPDGSKIQTNPPDYLI